MEQEPRRSPGATRPVVPGTNRFSSRVNDWGTVDNASIDRSLESTPNGEMEKLNEPFAMASPSIAVLEKLGTLKIEIAKLKKTFVSEGDAMKSTTAKDKKTLGTIKVKMAKLNKTLDAIENRMAKVNEISDCLTGFYSPSVLGTLLYVFLQKQFSLVDPPDKDGFRVISKLSKSDLSAKLGMEVLVSPSDFFDGFLGISANDAANATANLRLVAAILTKFKSLCIT
ncbi:hypothetical protein EDC01DRAFT_634592 [Geopyxis carbonaria]|nr:hypothetical protein EDC01DRAFT_634592 [Geopyxis carbonaria]